LVLEDLDQFKGSMAMIAAMGRWSLGAHAQRRQAGSGKGAACQRLALAAIVVSRWSKDFDVIFIMFGVLCTFCEFIE
jgi:hypothetical protein